MKRETGFSLVELLIVIAILGLVLAATSDTFVGLLRGYKQQSKIAETNIEGIIGLEMMRRDLEKAGYGLPWEIPAGTTYTEETNANAQAYNDDSNPPRAILSGLDATGRAYLVIKAISVARNDACTKWTHLLSSGATTSWTTSSENLRGTDRVIVINPGTPKMASRTLERTDTGSFFTTFSNVSGYPTSGEHRIIYGVDPDTDLIMPFNRADYYVSTSGVEIPKRCASGTGILMKAVENQSGTGFMGSSLPVLDCVADMQVVMYRDADVTHDGVVDAYGTGWVAADAKTIRNELKEIHVYILTHEGQRDTSYTQTASTVLVGEQLGATRYGRNFDLTTITDWQNYRWKVYTIVVHPKNLK